VEGLQSERITYARTNEAKKERRPNHHFHVAHPFT
jgi:hypothetical protein